MCSDKPEFELFLIFKSNIIEKFEYRKIKEGKIILQRFSNLFFGA